MKKEDLKLLVKHVYDVLLKNIDSQKDPTKEQVIAYFIDAAESIRNIDAKSVDSIQLAKQTFTNKYKEIAKKTLLSYKTTNNRLNDIAQTQAKVIHDYEKQLDNLPQIKEEYINTQMNLSQEVERANQKIKDLSQQIKKLENSSNLDALTKIFNRRALDTFLKSICNKKPPLQHELYILLLDIDDFKQINDKYGHIAGDKVLILVANILKKTLRDGDKVFRYGGEEFLVVLNRINMTTCKDIGNRILNLISSNQLFYKGNGLQVTVSIGATRFHQGDTSEVLIDRADKALYISKKNGKNQMSIKA